MKIFLTGASGMVGRNLRGHPRAEAHEWLTPSSDALDLRDFTAVRAYVRSHKPDLIVHAAGKVGGIQANIREPVRFLIDNLDIGRNILLAAVDASVLRVINLGSTCMYPKDRVTPLAEEDLLAGRLEQTNEGYALAKITIARLAEYLCREHPSLRYKTIIPCNLFGLHDKFDPQWSHMIPAIIHKLHRAKVNGEPFVEVWGSGEARREFLFAEDLADAILEMIGRFDDVPPLMNVGVGIDYSVNEYYDTAAKVIGYEGGFVHDLSKPIGMLRKLSSTAKLGQFGWRPKHSLEQGIEKTYFYYLSLKRT